MIFLKIMISAVILLVAIGAFIGLMDWLERR